MANYKLIGQRNLRKYTESKTSPTYAAAIEAQTIVDALCGIPWKKVSARDATMTYHTEETVDEIDGKKIGGLDMNVRIRDQFDAALFCADHAGGQHRAYANAAVYHYELPEGTLPKLTRLVAHVTSDPYNSAGARIAILTNSTGEIPTNCNDCRTGDAHADGVAPRTVAENGNWFPTMADCVFSVPSASSPTGAAQLPSGGLQLQRHLFVFVLMESYSTVRGNWLEGCSYIRNLIEIETDAAIPGWTDGETVDCASEGMELVIRSNNVDEPFGLSLFHANRHVLINWGAGDETPYTSGSIGSGRQAVTEVFARFHNGESVIKEGEGWKVGDGFALDRGFGASVFFTARNKFAHLVLSHLLIPFSCPSGFSANKIRFDWNVWSASEGLRMMKVVGDVRYNVWIAHGLVDNYKSDEFSDSGLYDVNAAEVGRWRLVDSFLAPDRVTSYDDPWPAESFSHESNLSGITIKRSNPYTLLLTAFIGRDEIERLSDYSALDGKKCSAGMIGGDMYFGHGSSVEVCENCWSPKITLIG